ncbi:DNA repair protein RadC, partial [Stenotrophomonas cyclobalanopsidis]
LAHRYLAAELAQGESVGDNPLAVGRYLQHRLRGQARELFLVLFLDNRHRLIACEELFAGTINTAPVYPREVVRRALLHNAAAVILSHNHPSGDPEPSGADARITEELQQALALVDIRLLDHFVIGEGRPVSFAERGLLPQHQPRLFG